MPIFGISEEFATHARADFRDVANAHHGVVKTAADNFERATERGEIADVAIHKKDAFETGAVNPFEDLNDGVDERLRLQRDRARPASRVPERTAVTQRG